MFITRNNILTLFNLRQRFQALYCPPLLFYETVDIRASDLNVLYTAESLFFSCVAFENKLHTAAVCLCVHILKIPNVNLKKKGIAEFPDNKFYTEHSNFGTKKRENIMYLILPHVFAEFYCA